MDFVVSVYDITKVFHKSEQYGLTSQLRRASVSVPSNLAEGAARKTKNEFIRFLYISLASLSEIETQLILLSRLSYIDNEKELISSLTIIRKMLLGLIKSLKRQKNGSSPITHHSSTNQ